MPIYDCEQLDSELTKATNDLEELGEVPVMGRVTVEDKEVELDLLGVEYDEDANVLYFNMGARR
jgi:hypothetical protein